MWVRARFRDCDRVGAKRPGGTRVSEEAQKFLNAPVWYFNYTVTIKLNGSYGGRTSSSERVMSGTMLLGLRSQGPSLSVITGDAKPPDLISQLAQQGRAAAGAGGSAGGQAALGAVRQQLRSVTPDQVEEARAQFDAYINNYANWISGLNNDEEKSDEENERLLIQVRQRNGVARERYRWEFSGTGSAGGRDHGSASGGGDIMYSGEPSLEIDGANRKFKLLFQLMFGDSLQTTEALRGREEYNIGTIHYQTFEVKTGLHSGEQPFTKITPEYKFIEGHLPGAFGTSRAHPSTRSSRGNSPARSVSSTSCRRILPFPLNSGLIRRRITSDGSRLRKRMKRPPATSSPSRSCCRSRAEARHSSNRCVMSSSSSTLRERKASA